MENKKFKVGDKVRLNREVADFKYGKGDVSYEEIGKITRITSEHITVDFPCNRGWWGLETELVNVDFNKDDLQFGDVITLRNGERYVFGGGYIIGEDSHYYCDCDNVSLTYESDLTRKYDNEEYDIVKIERVGSIVYERKEEPVKEMTIAEISKALGYEVKIVKEDK